MIKNITKLFNKKQFPKLEYLNNLPLGAILINSNKKQYIVAIVDGSNYNHEVVLSNLDGTFEKILLSLSSANAKIAKDSENFYIVTSQGKNSRIYKFSNRSLILQLSKDLGDTNVQSIAADNYYLYLSDSKNGLIHKLDKSLITVELIDTKKYDRKNVSWVSEYITSTNNGYISIGLPKDEEEFYNMQRFLLEKFPRKIVPENNQINSIAYDKNNKRLFIAFSNFIAIIQNNQCSSFLYFKRQLITSIVYDNDINSLIISSGSLKKNFSGSVNILSNDDIDNMKNFILPFEFIIANEDVKKLK